VTARVLAAAAAREDADVRAALARWPNLKRDDHDRIVVELRRSWLRQAS